MQLHACCVPALAPCCVVSACAVVRRRRSADAAWHSLRGAARCRELRRRGSCDILVRQGHRNWGASRAQAPAAHGPGHQVAWLSGREGPAPTRLPPPSGPGCDARRAGMQRPGRAEFRDGRDAANRVCQRRPQPMTIATRPQLSHGAPSRGGAQLSASAPSTHSSARVTRHCQHQPAVAAAHAASETGSGCQSLARSRTVTGPSLGKLTKRITLGAPLPLELRTEVIGT